MIHVIGQNTKYYVRELYSEGNFLPKHRCISPDHDINFFPGYKQINKINITIKNWYFILLFISCINPIDGGILTRFIANS